MADIQWPTVPCCSPQYEECACGPQERVLRAVIRGDQTLTTEQREWCLSEIDKIEGHSRDNFAGDSDADIARGTIDAWTDFCRDKGLLS